MTSSDLYRGFRKHLLDLIDSSGVSDRHLSILATGSSDTVRTIRRGSVPRLDTLEALCHVLGVRLEMVPLDAPYQPPENLLPAEGDPEWSRRLRQEIRQDLVEILAWTRQWRSGEFEPRDSNRREAGSKP